MILDFSSVIPGISFILYIIFTIFGFYHKENEKIHVPFILYMSVMTVWGFGSFMMHANTGILTPLFWNRFMVTGLVGAPITIFHSILHISKFKNRRYWIIVIIGYAIYLLLVAINWSGKIVTDVWFVGDQFYYSLGRGAFVAYSLGYVFLILCIYMSARELRKTDDTSLKNKLKPVLYGAIILLIGELVNIYEPLGRYPIDLFAAMINAILIFFAIYKYRLVHYSMVVLRIILYIVLILITTFVFYGIIWLSLNLLLKFNFEYTFLISLALGIIASVIFQPLRRGTMTIVEKMYLGKRLTFLNSLRDFSSSLMSITDLNTLGDITVKRIVETFQLEWAFIVILDYTNRNYRMISQRGLSIPLSEIERYVIPRNSDFISRIIHKQDVVLRQNGNSNMQVCFEHCDLILDPSLALPLVFKERMNGCIVLGASIDREFYNQYEIETLEILASQCSVSLENAISFERLRRQQKRLQNLNNELIISRNKLEAFFDGITHPISIQDINYNIVTINFAASRYFNLPFDDVIGEKCYRAFFNRDKPCDFCMAQDCLHTSIQFQKEIKDESQNTVFSIQFYPVHMPAGSEKLILEFFQDITEQKQLQEELIQSEKLAGIGTLASGIAHEINNPLGGIIGTAEILLDEVNGNLEAAEYINDIIKYSESAAEIIKDLTNYTRKKQEKKEFLNVEEVLENSLALVRRGMSLENIRIKKEYEDIPPIEANANELQQVFLNIILNAVQVMEGGGTLTLQCERHKGNVFVSITDTGPGISETEIEKLFNPFYTTKDPGKGTGLGLSITHQLVYGMGGRITVKSSLGRGTSFLISIPNNEKERKRVRFVHADTEQMKKDVFFLQRKILVGEKGYTEETIHRREDDNAFHILAFKGLQPVGTVTCFTEEMAGKLPIENNFTLGDMKNGNTCAEIDRLAVQKAERGSIIPLGLMTLAYLYGKSKGAEKIFLDVFSDEKKHIAMYTKLGFQTIGSYSSPLPVTVMMLNHETDYEKKTQRMDHFVKPFMKRLSEYFDFTEEENSLFMQVIEEMSLKSK